MSSSGRQDETPPRAAHRWRVWVLAGSALIIVALMLASAAGGWWLANRTVVANAQNDTSDDPVTLVDSTSQAMPDVRGLTRDEASQVLADAGFSADIVRFVDAPSGAPAGTVVAQTPAFGTREPTEIVVELAVPSTMPDLAGMSRDDAVAALSDLGVAASIDLVYVPGAKTGTITSTSPAAGEPLGSTATIALASPGTERSLGDTRRLSGDCRESGKVSLAGTAYSASITCATDDQPRTTVWLLGARVDEVEATVGIDDTAKPGTSVGVEVLADGVVVFSGTAAFGAPVKVALPVSGVLQLAVRVGAADDQTVVFGDPVVRGSAEAITEITS